MELRPANARRWRLWSSLGKGLITFVYAGALLTATHLPDEAVPVEPTFPLIRGDQVFHFGAYSALAVLGALAVNMGDRWKVGVAMVIGLAGFAILDEVTQPYFGRQADAQDWLADFLGILVGCAGAIALGRWRRAVHAADQ